MLIFIKSKQTAADILVKVASRGRLLQGHLQPFAHFSREVLPLSYGFSIFFRIFGPSATPSAAVWPFSWKMAKPLQTSLLKSPSEADFCRDVCSGLLAFLKNASTLIRILKFFEIFGPSGTPSAAVWPFSWKTPKPLQTSLEKSPPRPDFSRDVYSRLLILSSHGVPPTISPKVLHTSTENASFCKGI